LAEVVREVSEDRPAEELREEEPRFRFKMSDRDKAWEKTNDSRIEDTKFPGTANSGY
jgi:hypothetical protein